MSRNKIKHFAEMEEWSHVLEPNFDDELSKANLRGSWGDRVTLELACGSGVYALALAERFPDAIVIGVDIKGARIWHGANEALERELQNVRFLRVQIEDLAECFADGEVDEIWITFPDPHPRKGKAKKRLTSPRFLEIYRQILKPGGFVHLKTDDGALFEYTLEVLGQEHCEVLEVVRDVYAPGVKGESLHIQTDYEKRHLAEGRVIKYVKFGF